jgi:hypothetical protein
MRYLSRRIMVPFEVSKLPMENKYQEALNLNVQKVEGTKVLIRSWKSKDRQKGKMS